MRVVPHLDSFVIVEKLVWGDPALVDRYQTHVRAPSSIASALITNY